MRPTLDPEACKQLSKTRATILETLRAEPDHFKALVLADVLHQLAPEHDPALAAQHRHFASTRPADWKLRAKELGLDHLLFHLARGWREAQIGLELLPLLERRAAEISEARAAGVQRGHIDAAYVPAQLAKDSRATLSFHPGGHLAHVAIHLDELHHGELELEARPGTGHFTFVEERGGSGTMIRERYREGHVVTILNTPWHDGVESRAEKSWTRWVEENLADLSRLSSWSVMPKRKRPRGRKVAR